jgi:hypothetical protein
VNVPEPGADAYNPDRPVVKNGLLLNQVKHFQQIERERMTEGEASEYIRRMTALLHPRTVTAGETPGE